MNNRKSKVAFLGLTLAAAILGLQPSVKHDIEGNLSLIELTSGTARASISEGRAVANMCPGHSGIYTSCESSSTTVCTPTTCQ